MPRDVGIGAYADIHAANDEVMGGGAAEAMVLVGGDSLVLLIPLFAKLTNCTTDQLRQIPIDEPGVFPREFHLA